MIVVDVGCARYGGDYSIERLVEWFKPHTLYGFDPNEPLGQARSVGATNVFVNLSEWGSAAWVYDGEIPFFADGLNSHVNEEYPRWPRVPCFDLARFIELLPEGPLALKIDAEGAEYLLLEHLLDTGAAARLTQAIIEWHSPTEPNRKRRRTIEQRLRREGVLVEEWRW